ncbi:phosphomannomutase/phosphoglucomutase [Candidatus Sumerlaeota bacterium]|nr:phosphomannomutase/phosphoglucomutase [Candidatus Sumerlaeota bacterium]
MSSKKFRSMFREYDIRGRLAEDELNLDSCERIIRGFAALLKKRGIKRSVVGFDNRKDSPAFADVTRRALSESGIEVLDIGLSLSPVVYFAQYHLESEGGVMVTASHNPDGWLGFKLAHGYSQTLGPKEIKELLAIIEKEDFVTGSGSVQRTDVRGAYLDDVVGRIKLNPEAPPPRIVIDCANGGAGVFAYELFQRLGCMTFQLYCDPDVTYPNYFPNPSDIKARKRLAEMVTHPYIKADIGLAFDGDGDRLGVQDENGEIVWSDKVLLLLAKGLLEKKKGAKVVFDVKCTQALPEEIQRLGGTPIMWKTGHSHVKSKMRETGAELAGERSGHIFFSEGYYGFDDGLFAGAKLLEYLSYRDESFSSVIASLPSYCTSPEIKAHCADDVKYGVVDRLVKKLKGQYGDRVIDINGARVVFDDGWGLVRASSNLPELVLIFEAKTEERMGEIREIFRQALAEHPEVSTRWENDIPSASASSPAGSDKSGR